MEIIKTEDTSSAVQETLTRFIHDMGKTSVFCKDRPGFIVNRLLIPYMVEALRLVDRGDASFKDVDTAMKLGAGYPMGPFELMDYVGLDTIQFILQGWVESGRVDPSLVVGGDTMLKELVGKGHLGRKSGHGFYPYPPPPPRNSPK